MKFLPEHVEMEFQQRMAQRPDVVHRLARKHCPEIVTAPVPDDAEQAASDLNPLPRGGTVYRGGVEFDFVVTCSLRGARRVLSSSSQTDYVRAGRILRQQRFGRLLD